MSTYLVFGATGGTGKHFLPLALGQGHIVRVLVRNPTKLAVQDAKLQVQQGSITDAVVNFDKLVEGADFRDLYAWRPRSAADCEHQHGIRQEADTRDASPWREALLIPGGRSEHTLQRPSLAASLDDSAYGRAQL